MVYRVVSTKLTEEEHGKLLEVCNREGCTPSAMIKDAIMRKINSEEMLTEESKIDHKESKELTMDDLRKALLKKKNSEKGLSDLFRPT